MHDGCSGQFTNGKQVVEKLRMMGFSDQPLQVPFVIDCKACGSSFIMRTFEAECGCGMVYGVTPCHAYSADQVQAAGNAKDLNTRS